MAKSQSPKKIQAVEQQQGKPTGNNQQGNIERDVWKTKKQEFEKTITKK